MGAVSLVTPDLLHGALHVAKDAAASTRVPTFGAAVQRHRHPAHEIRTGRSGTGGGQVSALTN